MKPTKYQEREDALISEIVTLFFRWRFGATAPCPCVFHILCWDSICFKQSQLLVKFLPLIFRKMAIPHQSIWKSPTTPVKLTWLENGYPFFSIYVFSLSKMGIPSSVRYVSRWVLGGSPATSGNSPSFPALGSPAGFGAVGTSNSDGKTPGKPCEIWTPTQIQTLHVFVHILFIFL